MCVCVCTCLSSHALIVVVKKTKPSTKKKSQPCRQTGDQNITPSFVHSGHRRMSTRPPWTDCAARTMCYGDWFERTRATTFNGATVATSRWSPTCRQRVKVALLFCAKNVTSTTETESAISAGMNCAPITIFKPVEVATSVGVTIAAARRW